MTEDIWRHRQKDIRSKRLRYEFSIIKILVLCARGFINKNLNVWANSLSFSLMFALVPILALVIAIAQGFGYLQVIQDRIEHTFIGEYDLLPQAIEAAQRYLETAQGGVFLGVGLLILIWAVYSFFQNVEQCFNSIWNVQESRDTSYQIVTYISILVLLPMLIVVSTGFSSFVLDMSDAMGFGREGWLRNLIDTILPYLLTWGSFALMYKFIPNTRVDWRSAIIPAIVMGTLFQVMQWALVNFVVILSRTSIVYGAFAMIPILLMIMQWTSLLILIGAQFSFSIQNNENFEYEQDIDSISHRYEDFIALHIAKIVIARFQQAQPPISSAEIAEEQRMPIRLVRRQLKRLLRCGIITPILGVNEDTHYYQPAIDTPLLTDKYIQDKLYTLGAEGFLRALNQEIKDDWDKLIN